MIEAHELCKRFGTVDVLRGLDLRIARGRVTAIVGPNGAGKTTFIKSVLGLTRPDSGTLTFDGVQIGDDDSYRARIGYMPQIARFPDHMTGSQLLALLRELRGSGVWSIRLPKRLASAEISRRSSACCPAARARK